MKLTIKQLRSLIKEALDSTTPMTTFLLPCQDCDGDGTVVGNPDLIGRADPRDDYETECEACDGSGSIETEILDFSEYPKFWPHAPQEVVDAFLAAIEADGEDVEYWFDAVNSVRPSTTIHSDLSGQKTGRYKS
jgi:hypothetical protein